MAVSNDAYDYILLISIHVILIRNWTEKWDTGKGLNSVLL